MLTASGTCPFALIFNHFNAIAASGPQGPREKVAWGLWCPLSHAVLANLQPAVPLASHFPSHTGPAAPEP